MSINITVHGSPLKCSSKTKILLDPDGNRKKLLEERRKLRLEQVRQKSKELASEVRKKVDNEKQKQIKKIEEKKKEELKNWKKQLKGQLDVTISEIGQAHEAAKKYSTNSFDSLVREESVDLIPAVTNIKSKSSKEIAKHKRKPCIYNDKENYSNLKPNHKLPKVIEEETGECEFSSDELPLKNCTKKLQRKDVTKVTKPNNAKLSLNQERQGDRILAWKCRNENKQTSSNKPKFGSYASFKNNKTKSSDSFKKTPHLIMSFGSSDTSLNSSSSSLEIQDIHYETNQQFTRIYSKDKKQTFPNHKVNVTTENSESIGKTPRAKFTQISDFLNKTQKAPTTFINKSLISEEANGKKTSSLNDLQKLKRDNFPSTKTTSSNFEKAKQTYVEHSTNQSSSRTEITSNTTTNNLKESFQENSGSMKNHTQKTTFGVTKTQDLLNKKSAPQPSLQLQKSSQDSDILQHKTDIINVTSYDYNNRFQKTINPKKLTSVLNEKFFNEANATQNAEVERETQKSREKELETIRKKAEERSQKALEREKIRRDFEMLETKLEALTKDKQLPRSFSNVNENISEVRLKLLENERIHKINSSIENVMKRPVTITLPEINQSKPSISQFSRGNLTAGINLVNIEEDSGTINSSDSCCSILLNYVENQTKQINKDIQNCDNNQKNRKLKELLSKLEILKANLLKELEKSEKSTANKNIQTMFESISDLRQEREKIMLLNSEKKDLEKREQELRKREVILEMKLQEFYCMKKSKVENKKNDFEKVNQKFEKTKTHVDVNIFQNGANIESCASEEVEEESSECIDKKVVHVDKPIEIVIKVKEPKQKMEHKTIRKKSDLIVIDKPPIKKHSIPNISTPVKVVEGSQYTESTVYKSPPETIRTELGEIISKTKTSKKAKLVDIVDKSKEKIIQNTLKKSEFKLDQPSTLNKQDASLKHNYIFQKEEFDGKIIPNQEVKHSLKTKMGTAASLKKQYNPTLAQYIQRLLGMSRHSINMLGVSSSDIPTPNSSLVNVPNNVSSVDLNVDQQEHLKRIQDFIADNYSFLNEIEESLKKEEKSTDESGENLRVIEEIWKKSFKHKKKNDPNKLKNNETLKSILKKNVKEKKADDQFNRKRLDQLSTEEKVLEKYTELTDNCTQRIAELNDMIERVRKEKQKILEITLSSNGGANSETEYLEFVGKSKPKGSNERIETFKNEIKSQNSKKEIDKQMVLDNIPPISSIPETPIKETEDSVERVQLEKNKLTGVSRDSGISLSRPLTALDQRESPDIKYKTDETIFEPLLKDIPKPSHNNLIKPSVVNIASVSIGKQIAIAPNSLEYQQTKKNKPPASISRYSPQLIEDVPHELSTILEIDTPATSRLNVTLKDSLLPSCEKIIEEESHKKQLDNISVPYDIHDTFRIDFQKYPNFEDYAKVHNMDMELFDPEKSAYIKKIYEELFELTQNVDIRLKKFPSIHSFHNKENSTHENKSDHDSIFNNSEELTIKKFLTSKEFFEKIGATDLLDSKSLVDNTQSKSSTSKIMTENSISKSNEELFKEWCVEKYPQSKEFFEKGKISNKNISNVSNDGKEKKPGTSYVEDDSEGSLPDIMAELKRRNIIQHSFDKKFTITYNNMKSAPSFEKETDSNSSKENMDPKLLTKVKITNDISGIETISSSQSNNELGKDFEEMGLKWASLMLKKQQQSNALTSSTSSSFTFQNQDKNLSRSAILKNMTLEETHIKKDEENIKEDLNNTIDTTLDGKFCKPLNLREFLTQELQKRTHSNSNSTSLSDDSLTSLFLRSLLGSATHSPKNENDNVAGGSSDRQQKTSTPVLLGLSSSSRKSTSSGSNDIKLFSGESRISSVRFNSESLSSNENKHSNSK